MKSDSIVPEPPVNYTGQVVNGRIVEGFIREDGYWKWYWSCVLHGRVSERPMRIKDMRNRKGPGCCYDRAGKNSPTWKPVAGDLGSTKFNQIKNGASVRRGGKGIEFTVTAQDIWDQWVKQGGKCIYTGRDLISANSKTASLDRINSSLGYVPDNIEWVHTDVNLAKQCLTRSSFLSLCSEVTKNFTRVI